MYCNLRCGVWCKEEKIRKIWRRGYVMAASSFFCVSVGVRRWCSEPATVMYQFMLVPSRYGEVSITSRPACKQVWQRFPVRRWYRELCSRVPSGHDRWQTTTQSECRVWTWFPTPRTLLQPLCPTDNLNCSWSAACSNPPLTASLAAVSTSIDENVSLNCHEKKNKKNLQKKCHIFKIILHINCRAYKQDVRDIKNAQAKA